MTRSMHCPANVRWLCGALGVSRGEFYAFYIAICNHKYSAAVRLGQMACRLHTSARWLQMILTRVAFRPRYMVYIARREALRMWSLLPRRETKRILTVFDPSLIGFNGHHMEFARMLKEHCEPTFDVRFYGNLRAETKVMLSLPVLPICQDGIYPPRGDFDAVYRAMTESTIDALNRIDKRDAGPNGILIMHTATLYQLGGIAQWVSALPRAERPKLCLQFQFPLDFRLPDDVTIRARAIDQARIAADILARTGTTRLASNSELLAGIISKQLEQPCAVLPLPIRWPNQTQDIDPDRGVVFGFFGGIRPEKGASVIGEAIPEFAARYPETQFLVHAPGSESDPSTVEILKKVPQVHLIRGNFGRKADYFRQFTRASCILLPYDPIEYAYRSSGILVEALGLDRLIITTTNSWLSSEAKRRGGRVIEMTSFTPRSLLSSLSAARDLLSGQVLKPKINQDVIKENSAAAFCSALIELAMS